MENSHKNIQAKKLYEVVLTNGLQTEIKKDAVSSIIKMAVSDHSHFSFLLNQVDWFCESNLSLIPVLGKVLRAYRGTSKTAPKVVYNLLAVGLSIPNANLLVVDLLVNLILVNKDTFIAIEAIRENYPHKVCDPEMHITYATSLLELSLRMPVQRFDLLEIIIENLSTFDTQVALGEQFTSKVDYQDEDVLEIMWKCQELQNKYDLILQKLFEYVSKFDQKGKQSLLKQFYLIFQKVMMTVDNTKMIQFLAFYLAQSSLESSSSFLALLMVTIMEHYEAKTSKKIYIAALQYLRSYLFRSNIVPNKRIKKIIVTLLNQLQQKISLIQKTNYQDLNLNQFGQENYFNLYMLETIIYLKFKLPNIFNNQEIKHLYDNVINIASEKLHYRIFIDQNLILTAEKIQFKNQLNTKSFKTVFIDKFIPFFLPKSQKYINMKLNIRPKRQRPQWNLQQSTQILQMGTKCRKMMSFLSQSGGFTPITNGQC